ncbi:hypothetical protein DPMN_151118 [Dreissena polymorpha]|uniref:Uncharacterized protein n=1 Tax=Dreissena polymorpha TaxID=45954 RepID=A0A9D4FKK2_DREPO|nr:hypothetical protein DPMN_151118 [Dreissena polymorpha]
MSKEERQRIGQQSWPMFPHQLNDMPVNVSQSIHFSENYHNNVLSEANASMSGEERQQMGLQSWPMFPHQLNDIPVNRSQPTHLSENYQNYGMSETNAFMSEAERQRRVYRAGQCFHTS